MMRRLDLDKEIAEAFKQEVADMKIDDGVKRRIDCELINRVNREEKNMRSFRIKKVAIVAIACALCLVPVAFAAGQVTSLVSHSNIFNRCKDYSKLEKQEEKLGYKVNVIEEFSNGYKFDEMEVQDVKGMDDTNNVVETYKELCVEYFNKEGKNVALFAEQRHAEGEDRKPVKTLQCEDTTLNYYLDTYKFVPVDYELTEEDKKNEEREDYYISYGSDEVEISMASFVTWEKDGVYYNLLTFDTDMTADEMLQMATELL